MIQQQNNNDSSLVGAILDGIVLGVIYYILAGLISIAVTANPYHIFFTLILGGIIKPNINFFEKRMKY